MRRTIALTYVVEAGPRIFIDRIDIVGNYRTLDAVIRREFRIAEGDAYSKVLVEAGAAAPAEGSATSRTSKSPRSPAPPPTG